jgi:hypothetical protein
MTDPYMRPTYAEISVSAFSNEIELVHSLISQLNLFDLYSHDMNGLADHFFYDLNLSIPHHLSVSGFDTLLRKHPKLARSLNDCIQEFATENSWFKYELK